MDESMVMVCMQIITNTGSAKSSYIEAIQKAKKGDLGGAEISMNEGDDLYAQAHEVHTSLIQKEASGEKTEFSLILMHAEDQMASTEMAKVMAREFIELYREMKESLTRFDKRKGNNSNRKKKRKPENNSMKEK